MKKIEISRTSAIWRYYEYLDFMRGSRCARDDKNLNLCIFVRRIAFWSIELAVKLVVILTMVLLAVGSMFITVYWPIAHGFVSPQGNDLAGFVMLGTICWGIIALVASIVFGDYLYGAGKKWASNDKGAKQSLLLAWLRAKKQKVCPLIEVKD